MKSSIGFVCVAVASLISAPVEAEPQVNHNSNVKLGTPDHPATLMSRRAANGSIEPGLTYFLPMRYLKVTVSKVAKTQAKLKSDQADANTKLDAATKARKDAEAAAAKALKQLTTVPQESPILNQLKGAVDLAQADVIIAKQTEADATQATKDAAKALTDARGKPVVCVYDASVELLEAQADSRYRYVALGAHDAFRDDTVKLAVNKSGLLSSANVVAADRTADIIVEVAGAIAGLGKGSGPLEAAAGHGDTKKDEPPPPCSEDKDQAIYVVDPVTGLNGVAGLNERLRTTAYPFRLDFTVRFEQPAGTPAGTPDIPTAPDAPINGLFYRSAAPGLLTVSQLKPSVELATAKDADYNAISATLLVVPQAGPISYIPMPASHFVKNVSDVQFTDGSIGSWNTEQPSEALALVSLPVRIAKAIISVPADILQLKVNYSSQAKSLADTQAAEIKSAENLQIVKACLARAGDDDTAALACFK